MGLNAIDQVLRLTSVLPDAPPRGFGNQLRAYLWSVLIVAVACLAAYVLYRHFGLDRLSPVFLAPVLLSGLWFGARPAFLTALISFSFFNFYLVEPRFQFSIAGAEQYMNLAVFLAVALMIGTLSGRLRDETYRTREHARTLGALFRASQAMSIAAENVSVFEAVRRGLREMAGASGAVWRPGEHRPDDLGPASDADAEALQRILADLAGDATAATATQGPWRGRAMFVEGAAVAFVVWRTPEGRVSLGQDQMVDVLIDLGAATIARTRLTAAGAEAAAAARVDRLRNTLLSSLSHDFRTPLAAILASSSSLADYGDGLPAPDRRDLAQNIQEEAQSLSRYIDNLLSMTRVESGAVALQSVRVRPLEIVHEVADRLERRNGRSRTDIRELDGELYVAADPLLLAQAINNVLDNALRHTPGSAPVTVEVGRLGDAVTIDVLDGGPGVAPGQLDRIFEKFVRLEGRAEGSGLGLGLSISKGLIEAMDGSIEASNREAGSGLHVRIVLPQAEQ